MRSHCWIAATFCAELNIDVPMRGSRLAGPPGWNAVANCCSCGWASLPAGTLETTLSSTAPTEATGAPGSETPVGDPWLVHLPTTLVRLRANNDLPEWKKDAEENWVPVN